MDSKSSARKLLFSNSFLLCLAMQHHHQHSSENDKLDQWFIFYISFLQNATAWRCFTFSKQPGTMTSEATQQAGPMTPVSSPSVMNHVMHANHGEVSCQEHGNCSQHLCHLIISSCYIFCLIFSVKMAEGTVVFRWKLWLKVSHIQSDSVSH